MCVTFKTISPAPVFIYIPNASKWHNVEEGNPPKYTNSYETGLQFFGRSSFLNMNILYSAWLFTMVLWIMSKPSDCVPSLRNKIWDTQVTAEHHKNN